MILASFHRNYESKFTDLAQELARNLLKDVPKLEVPSSPPQLLARCAE
jgi:hypothetical protein